MKQSPEYVQTSTAAAMTLGFLPGQFFRGAKLGCINLLVTYSDGCRARCSYCGLSSSRNVADDDRTFIRVDWPVLKVNDIITQYNELGQREKNPIAHVQRVCVSMITHPNALDDMNTIISRFASQTDLLISALIGPTMIRSEQAMATIKEAGADTIGIAIDCATPKIFDKHRGRGVKGPHTWEHYWRVLEWSLAVFGSDNVTIHMVVGLGETEQQFLTTVQKAHDLGAPSHLFSFYPECGSSLAGLKQPEYGTYRRLQLGTWLINYKEKRIDSFTFNDQGQLIDFNMDIKPLIADGRPFMTSGCPGRDGGVACNRPFGNERPGRPLRNYPFTLDEGDKADIGEQIWEHN